LSKPTTFKGRSRSGRCCTYPW